MRRSYDVKFITEEKMIRKHRQKHTEEFIIGISLDADAVTEHEIGIAKLKDIFGIDTTKQGFDKVLATISPEPAIAKDIMFMKKPAYLLVYKGDNSFWKDLDDNTIINSLELTPLHNETLMGSWDEKSVGFLALGDDIQRLKEMEQFIQNKDITICLGNGGPFHSGGLNIVKASAWPQEAKQALLAKDQDRANMLKVAKQTGIENILRQAGKKWFALSPSWNNFREDSKYKVIFWLNPHKQDIYRGGWWTVEELLDWANDKGVICK